MAIYIRISPRYSQYEGVRTTSATESAKAGVVAETQTVLPDWKLNVVDNDGQKGH